MPYGKKARADGTIVDFDRVYSEYIAPAIEKAGMRPFRADEEQQAGDIREDMFQELLVADLVVADLTIDNPNVWYELGVRHALRSRGVVLICGGRTTTAFDLYTDRKLRYTLKDGASDPAVLASEISKLAEMVIATMASWHEHKVSPVYTLLPNLQEPDWKTLRIGGVRRFWEQHDAWESRVDLARRNGHIGDMLVLADEAPVSAFRAEAWIKAGEALRKAEHFRFALEQLERALEIDPTNRKALQEKGICLQRLALRGEPSHSLERAREHYNKAMQLHPADTEMLALMARVDKDEWVQAWRRPKRTKEQMREDAAYEEALLRSAIDRYACGYRTDPTHYFSGINALTLMHVHRHLTGDTRYDRDAEIMAGAVRFAASSETDDCTLFWAKATLGDLELLTGTPASVRTAYQEAIARNDRDWFALNSCLAQLEMLDDLSFRPDVVASALATFRRALERLTPPAKWSPRYAFLFSGHMIDAPDRAEPRFPSEKEPLASKRIADTLDQLGAGAEDLALCQAAAGGDLLFIEACQQRGVRCQILLPFPEPGFIDQSIIRSANGDAWRERFYEAKAKLTDPIRIMPEELGRLPHDVDPFERCNLWLLYSALACGIDKVRFIALWNGGGGDGPGGTQHMYNEVKRRTGRVTWIDTRKL